MTDNRRVALHLNNLATILQQLAVELVEPDPPPPAGQLSVEELRRQLVGRSETVCARCGHPIMLGETMTSLDNPAGWKHARCPEQPASVAEPECGCSLYTRCDTHETGRPRTCKCNGPDYRSSACLIEAHRHEAHARPDCNPALAD